MPQVIYSSIIDYVFGIGVHLRESSRLSILISRVSSTIVLPEVIVFPIYTHMYSMYLALRVNERCTNMQ